MYKKFPSPEDVEFIKKHIQETEYGITFDDDVFTYGGGRKRRTRKRITRKRITKKEGL